MGTLELLFYSKPLAEGGGFEPPVREPVRQFSKLLVSATHPSFLGFVSELTKHCSQMRCKGTVIISNDQTFSELFFICSLDRNDFYVVFLAFPSLNCTFR